MIEKKKKIPSEKKKRSKNHCVNLGNWDRSGEATTHNLQGRSRHCVYKKQGVKWPSRTTEQEASGRVGSSSTLSFYKGTAHLLPEQKEDKEKVHYTKKGIVSHFAPLPLDQEFVW